MPWKNSKAGHNLFELNLRILRHQSIMNNNGYDTLSERLLQESDLRSSPGSDDSLSAESETMDMFMRTPQVWRSPNHPFAEQNKKKPSILSSTYSLTSTIIGAGVLALPYAFKGAGMMYGIILLFLTACLARYSCSLLISSYLRTHKGSYDDLAKYLYGPWCAYLVRVAILLLNLGGTAGYMLVIKELFAPSVCIMIPAINPTLCGEGSGAVSESAYATESLAILMYGIVFPMACLESLSSLQLLSKLAFLCAFFLCVSVSLRSIQSLTQHASVQAAVLALTASCDVRLVAKESIGVIRALPLFAFSFVCHLNVLPVYDELRSRSPARMRKVINHAISFCTLFYTCIGAFGYARFCDGTPQNILAFPPKDNKVTAAEVVSSLYAGNSSTPQFQETFPANDMLITGARVAETLTCTLALPFIFFPTRLVFHNMVKGVSLHLSRCFGRREERQGTGNSLHPGTEAPNRTQGQEVAPTAEPGSTSQVLLVQQDAQLLHVLSLPVVRWIECFVLLSISFVLALSVPDISIIFGILGSTLCSFICFVLPAAFYLKAVVRFRTDPMLRAQRVAPDNWAWSMETKRNWWVSFKMAMAVLLLLYGLFIMVVGTAINIEDAMALSK